MPRPFASLVLFGLSCASAAAQGAWLPPSTPAGNPMTVDKALLGMALFWDEQMSSSNTTACGTCHIFSAGGTDPRAADALHPGPDGLFATTDDIHGSPGVPARAANGRYTGGGAFGTNPRVTRRKAPSVVNAAYTTSLFYDGRAANGDFRDPISGAVVLTGATALENLIQRVAIDEVEMGHSQRTWADVALKLRSVRPLALASNLPTRLANFVGTAQDYDSLFARAFGAGNTATPTNIIMALATYVRSIGSDRSPHDLAMRGYVARTPAQQRGLQLFNTGRNGASACSQCHSDLTLISAITNPGMSGGNYMSLPVPNSHNTGVRPIADDTGVMAITGNQADAARFRTPNLRNTALHKTWFHNGGAQSLREVIDFYSRGGDFHQGQASEIRAYHFTPAETDDLIAFLESLTDPRVASEQFPFDRPRLASETRRHYPQQVGTPTASSAGLVKSLAFEPVFAGSPQSTIAASPVPVGAHTFVLFGTQASSAPEAQFGLPVYLSGNNLVLVYAGQATATGAGAGVASYPFALPGQSALAGMTLCSQWLVLDPAGAQPLVVSDALTMTL